METLSGGRLVQSVFAIHRSIVGQLFPKKHFSWTIIVEQKRSTDLRLKIFRV
jgi:hypothetical protein